MLKTSRTLLLLVLLSCKPGFSKNKYDFNNLEVQQQKNSLYLDSINVVILNGREYKAITLLKKVIPFYNEEGDFENKVRASILIGDAYFNLRNMPEAFKNYQNAVFEAKQTKQFYQEGMAHLSLAFYYHENLIYEKAWQQIVYAENLCKYKKVSKLKKSVLSQKGIYYRRKGNLEKAIEYNEQAYDLCMKEGSPNEKFDYSINLSTAYVYTKQYEKALKVLTKGLEINQNEIKSKVNQANVLGALSFVNCLMKNEKLSVEHGKLSVKIAYDSGNDHMIKISSRGLARVYKKFGRYEEALKTYTDFVKYFEEQYKKQQEQDVTELIKGYEVKLKQEQINRLNSTRKQEQKLLKSKLNLSRFTLFSTILFFSLLGFVFFWFFKRYKERARIQKELLLKTVESEKQIEFLNAQEEERSRIALELHDGLGSLLSSVKLRLETKKIVQKENSFDDILRDLSIACSEVRMISHNLNNFSLSMGDFKNSMKDYVMSFKTENLKVNFQFTQNITYELPEKTKHHILRIVQELVGNVVKHASASEMNVGIVINEDALTALIEDNGIGFDLNGEHNGIGLKNVQMRVNALKGELEVFSLEGKSTQILIHVPLNVLTHENNTFR